MPWHIEQSSTLAAPVATVFEALTSADALRAWFAEDVAVEPYGSGAFRFWGKHTLGCPTPADSTQRITAFAPDRQLHFSWSLMGVPTEVELTLEAEAEGTKLTMVHRLDGELATTRPRELVDDFWRLALGNLGQFVTGGDVTRPDFGDPAPEIHITRLMAVEARPLWRALTEADSVNQWFNTTRAVVEPRVGGAYRVDWRYTVDGRDVVGGPTRILEMDRPHRLQLDWPDWRGDTTVGGQTITFCLFPGQEGTKVTFIHAGFTRASDLSDYPFGWAWFLSQLETEALRLQNEANPGQ
jgi:uncharacterized protein YndB with AHSA1/START domain